MSAGDSSAGGSTTVGFGPRFYGDPCRECGFPWSMPIDDAIGAVAALPGSYREVIDRASGEERSPDLGWSVTAYVCHVADNLRIWAERLTGIAAAPGPRWPRTIRTSSPGRAATRR